MAYDGTIPVPLTAAVMGAVNVMTQQKGWNASFNFRVGDSILPRARNAELANALHDPDVSDLIMIDADTYCSADDLAKLVTHEVDVVGAPYRTRNEPLAWPSVRWLHQDVALSDNGLLEVEGIGTGMMRVSRNAMQQLYAAEPESYKDPTCKPGVAKPVFWFDVSAGHLWGEDIVFCRKWRTLGGKIWTDPSITTAHIGTTSYTANLAQYLSAQPENIQIDDVIGKQTMVKNGFFKAPGAAPAPAHLHLPSPEAA